MGRARPRNEQASEEKPDTKEKTKGEKYRGVTLHHMV